MLTRQCVGVEEESAGDSMGTWVLGEKIAGNSIGQSHFTRQIVFWATEQELKVKRGLEKPVLFQKVLFKSK